MIMNIIENKKIFAKLPTIAYITIGKRSVIWNTMADHFVNRRTT